MTGHRNKYLYTQKLYIKEWYPLRTTVDLGISPLDYLYNCEVK